MWLNSSFNRERKRDLKRKNSTKCTYLSSSDSKSKWRTETKKSQMVRMKKRNKMRRTKLTLRFKI